MKIKLNMKKLFLLFTLLLSINIQAWNLEKVGNIKAKTWNELFEGFTSNEIYVSAGSNGEISNVRLNFDMGLGRFSVTYVFNGTDTSQVKGLNNLRDYLDKSIRWTEIAKKNSAETQKEIGNNCGTNEVSCSATFFSNNDAKQTDFILEIKEKETFTLNEGSFYIEADEVARLKRLLSYDQLNKVIKESLEKNLQSQDLFN